jgi:hypothetical protein
VIDVEMGAERGIDRLRREARRAEILEEGAPLLLVPLLHAGEVLVVADARVDDDASSLGLDEQSLDAHARPAVRLDEVGLAPVDREQVLGRGVGQDPGGLPRDVELEHPLDAHVSDLPLKHVVSCRASQSERTRRSRSTSHSGRSPSDGVPWRPPEEPP